MGVVKNLLVRCGADFSELSKEMNKAKKYMATAGKELVSAGKILTSAITVPLIGIGVASAKTAMDFEAAMNEVSAISGATGGELEKLSELAKEMGRTTKFSAAESADALKYMGMAGWKTEDMISGLPGILNLAAAGGTELGLTSDIVTDGLTALGLSASDTDKFVDIMAATCNSANTNIEMMGETLSYVGPVAGTLGINMSDLSLAVGLMANAGIKGGTAGTALRSGLTNLVKPTDQMQSAMEKYNISLFENADGSVDLMGTMKNLRTQLKDVDKTTQANILSSIFGKEAMSGWASIVNATEDDFNKLALAIDGSDGTAKNMADTMMAGAKGALIELKSAIEGVAITIGERIIPYVEKFADWMSKLCESFQALTPEMQDMILKGAMIAASVGPILLILGKLSLGIGTLIGWMAGISRACGAVAAGTKGVGAIMTAVFGPAGIVILIVAAIAAVVAGLMYLWKNNEDFRNFIITTWQAIVDFMTPILETIKNTVIQAWENIVAYATPIIENIKQIIISAWEYIVSTLEPIIEQMKQTIGAAWEFIKTLTVFIWDIIKDKFMTVFDNIKTLITAFVAVVKYIWTNFGDIIIATCKNSWDMVVGVFKGVFKVIEGIFDVFSGLLSGNWSKVWEGMKNIVSGIWDGIVSIVKGGINFLISALNSFIRGINKVKVPSWVPGIGGMGFSISQMPYLAKGTSYFKGGLAVVGEQGPELVSMPRGASVTPNRETESMLGGLSLNISNFYNNTDRDIEELAEQLAFMLKKKKMALGGA